MLNLETAKQLIEAAKHKASEIGQPMNIAVVEAGGNLLAFEHMDNAWLGSIDIAINKAFTARAFDMSTQDLGTMAQPNKPLFGIEASNGGRIVIFAGGLPVSREGQIIGAIGVSGGTVEQDQAVAEAGLSAL